MLAISWTDLSKDLLSSMPESRLQLVSYSRLDKKQLDSFVLLEYDERIKRLALPGIQLSTTSGFGVVVSWLAHTQSDKKQWDKFMLLGYLEMGKLYSTRIQGPILLA